MYHDIPHRGMSPLTIISAEVKSIANAMERINAPA